MSLFYLSKNHSQYFVLLSNVIILFRKTVILINGSHVLRYIPYNDLVLFHSEVRPKDVTTKPIARSLDPIHN